MTCRAADAGASLVVAVHQLSGCSHKSPWCSVLNRGTGDKLAGVYGSSRGTYSSSSSSTRGMRLKMVPGADRGCTGLPVATHWVQGEAHTGILQVAPPVPIPQKQLPH